MCGRFSNSKDPAEIARHFQAMLTALPKEITRYNIAPSGPVLVVRNPENRQRREIVPLRWGLIPSWAKDSVIGNKLINARGETVAVKPAFKVAFRRRRCLIPADGFFEWQKRIDRGFEQRKQPFHIRFKDERLFGFAGLWESWKDHNGATVESCVILTTSPNKVLEPLHHRMPVIVDEKDYDLWLHHDEFNLAALQSLLRAYPPSEMVSVPVGLWVNNPRVDDPKCLTSEIQ